MGSERMVGKNNLAEMFTSVISLKVLV